MKYTDEELIAMILAGGHAMSKALRYLFDHNQPQIEAMVLRNSGDKDDANIILVDGLMELCRKVRSVEFQRKSKLSTFLYSICRFKWIDELRKAGRNPLTDAEDLVNVVDHREQGMFREVEERDRLERLQDYLELLPEKCREVLGLTGLGYSGKEIAEIAEYKNEQNARNKISKCRKRLFKLIEDDPDFQDLLRDD